MSMKKGRSARGHNHVFLGGYVDGGLISGTTSDGGKAFSFVMAFLDSGDRPTRIRVNAYGYLATVCDEQASENTFCFVVGEVMNRLGKYGRMIEVRVKEIEFFPGIGNYAGEDRSE